MLRKVLFWFILDFILLFLSYFLCIYLKYDSFIGNTHVFLVFIILFFFWSIIADISKKILFLKKGTVREIISVIALSDIIAVIIISILIRFLSFFTIIKFVILYSVLLTTFFEIIVGAVYGYLTKVNERPFYFENDKPFIQPETPITDRVYRKEEEEPTTEIPSTKLSKDIRNLIIEETDTGTFNYIARFFSENIEDTLITFTTTTFNIFNQPRENFKVIINLKRINNVQYLNKMFEAINVKLENGGIFISNVETKKLRWERISRDHRFGVNYILYFFDFLLHRVLPKLNLTKKVYFYFTQGKNRALSKAETYGRLYSCGFEIIEEKLIKGSLFFVVRKIKEPVYDNNPSYGPLIRLNRVGRYGEIFSVYKFRTMHPYAEYLHDYILRMHGYSEIGKPANDFRLTAWGKFLRRYWLDELPQLINLAKGDMKIVGARPLSERVYRDYPADVKRLRDKYKPGCIPPYVSLLMQSMDASIEAERLYLLEKEKHPYTTDFKFFFKAVYNILTNKIRSS